MLLFVCFFFFLIFNFFFILKIGSNWAKDYAQKWLDRARQGEFGVKKNPFIKRAGLG